ncbi:MAG: hypothetical protein ACREBG_00040 [Pyrinomonadaceae bacterium]
MRFAKTLAGEPEEAYLLSTIKNIFLWRYARNTWQWDVLCALILVFIFLTPKSWFEGSKRRSALAHQNRVTGTLLVGPEVIENESDNTKLKQRVRALSGRVDAEIVEVRKILDKEGRTLGYQVDIR